MHFKDLRDRSMLSKWDNTTCLVILCNNAKMLRVKFQFCCDIVALQLLATGIFELGYLLELFSKCKHWTNLTLLLTGV